VRGFFKILEIILEKFIIMYGGEPMKLVVRHPHLLLNRNAEYVTIPPGEYELKEGNNPNPESVAIWLFTNLPDVGEAGASLVYLIHQSKDPDSSGITLV
jgi:hypothetical protein